MQSADPPNTPERPPRVGELVRVRSRQWLVEEVLPDRDGGSPQVSLACADDDAQGQSLTVFWDYELDRAILQEEGWASLASQRFDSPRYFAAFFNTLRWNCTTATQPNLFQAPFRAGIQLDAYQMEPLRKALLLPLVNLFIADDTGLGKTIEAALIARELLLRRKVKRIVVAAPPSVLEQWKAELEDRFGLLFEILDRAYVSRMRRERGFGVNPWRTHSRFLVSHNLLIDPAYADPLREWLGETLPGSLLILDEAHHAAPSSGGRYGIETKFTRAVRDLGGRFEHRLFLSATPHNGHSNSFSTLLELLDPYRFTRGVKVRGKRDLEAVMVRRLKEDIRTVRGGFPQREVVPVVIDNLPADAPELVLSQLLNRYRGLREERHAEADAKERAAANLLAVGLQQRLLSSTEAFARSLQVHERTVRRHWDEAQQNQEKGQAPSTLDADALLKPAGADDERAEWDEAAAEVFEAEQLEAVTLAAGVHTKRVALWEREQALLAQMQAIAEEARYKPDAKTRCLIDWIRANQCQDLPPFGKRPAASPPTWNNRRVLIFTENREGTKRYLRAMLEQAIEYTDNAEERIRVIDGLTSGPRREEVQRRFNADPAKDPLRILIATDAAREGLNFQAHCADLFHFDLPWNPGRIEQRNGRIDRKLQPAPVVRCHYFVLPQRMEDRVLQVLVTKTETIKRELGSLAKVIDDDVERRLNRGGIRHDDVDQLKAEVEGADLDPARKRATASELEDARERQADLAGQIERCRTLLERSRTWVRFDEPPFRDALSCSLELLGAAPLEARQDEHGRTVWAFPPLERRAATDPSWTATLDSLRPPRELNQKLADWRKEAPIRPVVFKDAGALTDDTVHLHLEQRVAQRLLARFRAQGFVYNDLSRACLAQTKDSIPRVILLGRLALYGHRAERLHEELVPVTARWVEPSRRESGTLRAYARDAETHTLALLDEALGSGGPMPNEVIQQRLLEAAPTDIEALRPQLEHRAEEFAATAAAQLAERGEREARQLAETLTAQRQRVVEELERHDAEFRQLTLGFKQEETRQLEADVRHWQRRLQQFDRDLEGEPRRIQAFYEVRAQRVEPVGLVYLWPETN